MPSENPVRALLGQGQSPWLDQLRREWLADGTLARWIEADGLRGVTSNPSIFGEAIAESAAYDEEHRALAGAGLDLAEIYDRLTASDIQAACAVLEPVFRAAGGGDGLVSHEVSPALADDTAGTIAEAHRLWADVDRPNVMIKIPATDAGMPAIRRCLADGLNINITLMFSLSHYEAVAEAYLAALETRRARGEPIDGIVSVASFFVSRVDTLVDRRLDELVQAGTPAERLAPLRGRAAVANAKRAYRRFSEVFGGERFAALAADGARRQRVLWASTSTKDPAYRDVMYVEELIGPETVNTMPLATLEAFREHGLVRRTVDRDLAEADRVVAELAELGIDLEALGRELSRDGVRKFQQALDELMAALARRHRELAPVA